MAALKAKPDIGDQINEKIIAPLAKAHKLDDMPDCNAEKPGSGQEKVERLTNPIALHGIDTRHRYLTKRAISPATAPWFGVGMYRGAGSLTGPCVIPGRQQVADLAADHIADMRLRAAQLVRDRGNGEVGTMAVFGNTFFEERVEQLFDLAGLVERILSSAGLEYRVVGGLAAYLYVEEVEPDAGRLTVVRRDDLERIARAPSHSAFGTATWPE